MIHFIVLDVKNYTTPRVAVSAASIVHIRPSQDDLCVVTVRRATTTDEFVVAESFDSLLARLNAPNAETPC